MKMRNMGKLGLSVSAFGMGCMRFPLTTVDGVEVVDESISTPAIRYAIDHGVNYFDTAYIYSGQKNEMALGHALRDGYREKVYIATKLPSWKCDTAEDMERILNEQLQQLETDYIDFYLLHSMRKEFWEKFKSFGALEFLDKAKAEGKIRYAGFSFHDSYELFEEILDSYDWDMCQIQFNFIDVNNQAGLRGLQLCGERNIPVVIMEGLLGGRLAKAPAEVQALYDAFPVKRSPVEWAFRWLCDFPQIATVLSGVTDLEMTKENIEIFDRCGIGCMTEDEKKLMEAARVAYLSKISCTGCQYCMPCPNGVKIPKIFEIWNNLSFYSEKLPGNEQYKCLIEHNESADKCVECGLCESACPQQLEIIKNLKTAHSEMK